MHSDSIKEGYARKFASKDQDEIGQDPICESCGGSVSITDFRTAEALEIYCCGSGNDEGFCQYCQDKSSLRAELEDKFGAGNVFDTDEVQAEFTIEGFQAPFCYGKRKSDGEKVRLQFNHMPRLYWLPS